MDFIKALLARVEAYSGLFIHRAAIGCLWLVIKVIKFGRHVRGVWIDLWTPTGNS
jgi:hypothetical protein